MLSSVFLLFALLAAKCAYVVAVPAPHHSHSETEAIPGRGGNADGGSPSFDPKVPSSLINYDYCNGGGGGNSGSGSAIAVRNNKKASSGRGGLTAGGGPQHCQGSLINVASGKGGPGGTAPSGSSLVGSMPEKVTNASPLIQLGELLSGTDTTNLLNPLA